MAVRDLRRALPDLRDLAFISPENTFAQPPRFSASYSWFSSSSALALGADEIPGLEGPSAVGRFETTEPKKAPLSKLIDRINQAFGADLGPESILSLEQRQDKMVANKTLADQAKANTLENYKHGFDPAFLDALVQLREGNAEFFSRAIEDPELRAFIVDTLRPLVYREQREAERAERTS